MTKINAGLHAKEVPEPENEAVEPEFKPLSAEEARRWRERQPVWSMRRVLAWQAVAGAGCAMLAGLLGGVFAAWSAAYGAVALWVPAVLFARGVRRQSGVLRGSDALAGLMVWELVKVVLTVLLLAVAPRVVPQLNWLALLAGFVVTMKVYGLALWLAPKRAGNVVANLN